MFFLYPLCLKPNNINRDIEQALLRIINKNLNRELFRLLGFSNQYQFYFDLTISQQLSNDFPLRLKHK